LKTKVILEIGCNHNGDYKTARDMITEAHKLGVWGVKLQKRDIMSIPEELRLSQRDLSNSFGKTYQEHREYLEFSLKQISALNKYAEDLGLKFCCTAFDPESIKGLVLAGVRWIKFPSQLYLDSGMYKCYQKYKTNKQRLMVSTGMHNQQELYNVPLLDAVDVMYHCVSIYPAKSQQAQLGALNILKSIAYNDIPSIGYSSHEAGAAAVPYAVAMGAEYIERHFTLCKGWKGSDHSTVSSEPNEIADMVREIKKVEDMIGPGRRELSEQEKIVAKQFRRDL
jgi:sialic acid synthase